MGFTEVISQRTYFLMRNVVRKEEVSESGVWPAGGESSKDVFEICSEVDRGKS
jgi:hypothetical protein